MKQLRVRASKKAQNLSTHERSLLFRLEPWRARCETHTIAPRCLSPKRLSANDFAPCASMYSKTFFVHKVSRPPRTYVVRTKLYSKLSGSRGSLDKAQTLPPPFALFRLVTHSQSTSSALVAGCAISGRACARAWTGTRGPPAASRATPTAPATPCPG